MVMSFGSVAKKVVATKIVAADGSGDFTDIQTAIDALPAGGGVVYVKEGTYTITVPIIVDRANVALVGAGQATRILTTLNIHMIRIWFKSGVHIEKLYFYGAGVGLDNHAFNVQSSTDLNIVNCWIENCGGRALVFIHDTNLKINGCFIINNKHRGISVGTGTDMIVSNNVITGNSLDGIYLNEGSDVNIVNNKVSGNGGIGVSSNENREVIITANQIRDNASSGIKFVNVDNSNIENNMVVDNNDPPNAFNGGIYLDVDSDDNIILGNTVIGNAPDNIIDLGTGNEIGHNKTD